MPSSQPLAPPLLDHLKLAMLPTLSLIPYPGNARVHSRRQIQNTAHSIKTFGWTNPILIDAERKVIAGHCRLASAKLLGLKAVPTIPLDHLSDAEVRAYTIADNALAEQAGWSKRQLKAELEGLMKLGYDTELTMLGTLKIDSLLSIGDDDTKAPDDIVALPSRKPAVSRVGDRWVVGRHVVVCGDARLRETYDLLLEGELAQIVFTDPPYGNKIKGNVSGLAQLVHDDFVMGSDGLSPEKFVAGLLRPTFRCLAANCVAGAIGYFCIDWRAQPRLVDAADGVFAKRMNMIVWAKSNAGMGSFYRSQHELIEVYLLNQGQHINNFGLDGRYRTNVWSYAGANVFGPGRKQDLLDHPTVKPKNMVADALLDCSQHGAIVLDPFLGSATTLVAAEMTGRRGYGIELDPRYCDVSLRRLMEATGEVALLGGTKPFAEVGAERGLSAAS